MKTSLKLLITALAIASAALALPALASAETFCVNAAAACPAGGNDFGDLQDALNAAATQDGNDEVLVGDKQAPYFGPFTYAGGTRAGADLTIKGVGGRPSLTAPVGDTVLQLAGGSLQNVAIVTDFGEGQALNIRGGDVKEVKLEGPGFLAPDLNGIFASRSTLEDVEITGGYEPALTAGGGEAGAGVVARRLHIHDGPSIGVVLPPLGDIQLSDSRVSGKTFAVSSAGSAKISRSLLTTSGPDSVGLNQFASLGPWELDHVTVAHTGSASGTDSAFRLQADTPIDSHIHAVAIAGYTRGFRRVDLNGSPENLVISDSVWDPANDELTGHGAGVLAESRNIHTAPEVVNLAGGDLQLRSGSAAIDRDQVSDLSQFTDLEGVAALDGDGDGIVRPDAGALEFRPGAPTPAGGGAGSGTPANDVTAPVLRKLRLVTGRKRVARAARVSIMRAGKLKLAFTASEASRVRIVPTRIVRGKLAKARGAIVRNVAAGKGSILVGKKLRRLKLLRPGKIRLVVTAADAAGNRAAKRVLTLRLKG